MRRGHFRLGAVSVLMVLALGLPATTAAGPSLTLNPPSGNPPTVTGNLGGGGWACGSGAVPVGSATVSGSGVAGSATINRDGSIGGSFTVRGTAGQRVEVKVTASTSCPSAGPPIYLQATAFFTFNTPPPTATATAQPTSTRLPTVAVLPTSTPVPTATTRPTLTPEPTSTPESTPTPEPTSAPQPSLTPRPTSTPEPTAPPEPSATTRPESTPEPTLVAEPTPEPEPTSAPESTLAPEATAASRLFPATTAITAAIPSPTEPRATVVSTTPSATADPAGSASTIVAVPSPSVTATWPADPPSGQGSLIFVGCTPRASQVQVEFLPLGMWGAGGTTSNVPSGPGLRVATMADRDEPGKLTFQPPSMADEGRIYRVSPVVDDPLCSADPGSASQYWLAGAGKNMRMPVVAQGQSRLEVSNNGDKAPIPLAVVKGAFMESGRPAEYVGASVDPPSPYDGWETQVDFYGSVDGRKQLFRWSTDLAAANSAVLQVAAMPFSTGYEANPLSPPGLMASWPVDCVDCEFVVDLSPLPVPEPKEPMTPSVQTSDSVLDKLGQLVGAASDALGNLFGNVGKALASLFGGSKAPTAQPSQKAVQIDVPSSKVTVTWPGLGGNSVAYPVNPLLFTTFYFRVVPLNGADPAGSGSNAVIMHWAGASPPPDIKISFAITPTPTPAPSPYETEIVSYHGIIPPIGQCTYGEGLYSSFVVLQDAWWDKSKPGFYFTTNPIGGSAPYFKKGNVLCEPAPKEPSLFEKIGKWVSGAWNWVAEAYSDLKNTVVSAVGFFIPDALCSDSCVGALLDAALVSMGIPPDIPNLDQLMSQGIDYLAQQTVAQIGLPPEVLNQTGPYAGMLLSEAEAKFKEEAQAKLKEGLQQGVKQIQLGYADSVGWLPKGVPVRPNDYQQPGMLIEVTRKGGVPGGEAGCTAKVYDSLTIDPSKLGSPPPGYANVLKEINERQALVPGKYYDPFVDLSLPVPPLAPGSSVTIPMSFRPNVYKSGWNPLGIVDTTDYFRAWGLMEMLGDVHLSVWGCGSAKLDVAADGTYGTLQP